MNYWVNIAYAKRKRERETNKQTKRRYWVSQVRTYTKEFTGVVEGGAGWCFGKAHTLIRADIIINTDRMVQWIDPEIDKKQTYEHHCITRIEDWLPRISSRPQCVFQNFNIGVSQVRQLIKETTIWIPLVVQSDNQKDSLFWYLTYYYCFLLPSETYFKLQNMRETSRKRLIWRCSSSINHWCCWTRG